MAKNKFGKVTATVAGLAILVLTLLANYIIAAENGQLKRNVESANDRQMTNTDNKNLVIYFSRSGNTERMAMDIAKYYQAQLVHLEAADYRPGFLGLVNAVKDSRSNRAEITPETLDLSPYQTIFIGSPIWWYSPAPPAWQFIHNNDFTDKNVVLFTTFNSSFKQQHIDEFQNQVEAKGGNFIKHIYVKRGRITQQINDETLSKKTRDKLDRLQLQ
ncbi:MAG: hypothetical protein DRR06_09310 [Gammaproteobacteria bacterium]|nr:MAG: hypothetical protein DRR42_21455 [Gammaproteobacteria bacterium]RLA44580.1 MAG: hypothetical protein DRR06_09310 [Gammaproteobacteria bacterium]